MISRIWLQMLADKKFANIKGGIMRMLNMSQGHFPEPMWQHQRYFSLYLPKNVLTYYSLQDVNVSVDFSTYTYYTTPANSDLHKWSPLYSRPYHIRWINTKH